jgi:hypothetical protein
MLAARLCPWPLYSLLSFRSLRLLITCAAGAPLAVSGKKKWSDPTLDSVQVGVTCTGLPFLIESMDSGSLGLINFHLFVLCFSKLDLSTRELCSFELSIVVN